MIQNLKFDYYYGTEAEQFSFYRVPRLLIKDERFKNLSSDAKLLYGLMLDRMSLSMKNGWLDSENRAYIYYTLEDIMEDLGCAKATCVKIIGELDSKKGIGLIEKKRQGLGRPDMIYVKNFVMSDRKPVERNAEKGAGNIDESTEVQKLNFKKYKSDTSRGSETILQEVQKADFQKSRNCNSGSLKTEPQEVQKSAPNYTDINYTDSNYTDSIYPSSETENCEEDGMDSVNAYIALIKENVDYEHYMRYAKPGDRVLFEELFEVICEVVCVKRKTVKVGGEDYPYELVKGKFLKLNSSHLEYVIGCMQDTNTKITNIKAYMVTALYNAPSTINHYYQQKVQYDMYGGGWEEKGII